MNRGLSLVELLVALACSGVLMLAIYHVHQVSAASSASVKGQWYCMQSLRQASLRLSMDLAQSACLMPQDLKVLVDGSRLYIAGIPVTSSHPGIQVSRESPPPYYSLVLSSSMRSVVLDTVDIDGDSRPDFWAGLGMISDASACSIGHAYQRGCTTIPVTLGNAPRTGDRIVPAVCYELRADGLYRNNALLAEAVVSFTPRISGRQCIVAMRAQYHGYCKDLCVCRCSLSDSGGSEG